jgi:hypothetical protein
VRTEAVRAEKLMRFVHFLSVRRYARTAVPCTVSDRIINQLSYNLILSYADTALGSGVGCMV